MKKLPQGKIKSGDFIIIGLTALLVVFGTVMIFSASYYTAIADGDGPYAYLKKQLIFVAIGIVGMWIASKLDYHFWGKTHIIWFLLGLIVVVFIIENTSQYLRKKLS